MNAPRPLAEATDRLEIASDWLLRMEADALSESELAEWLIWYDADPANRAAFEKLQGTFEALRGQSAEAKAAMARAVGAHHPAANDAGSRRNAGTWSSRHRAWLAAAATAAAFILGIGIWDAQEATSPVQTAAFKTERAVHRQVALPDGSRVQLGARSQLFTNFTPQARYLVLEGGEAYFSVQKDSERPFLVQAGSVTVRAVGTEFNVRRIADQTVVAVTEGAVEVIQDKVESRPAVLLKSGEQVALDAATATPAVTQVPPNAVVAWQEGRFEFVDEPLRRVIGTINRYSPREIVITDKGAGEMRFTGTVASNRIDQWLDALPDVLPVGVSTAGNETILISNREAR